MRAESSLVRLFSLVLHSPYIFILGFTIQHQKGMNVKKCMHATSEYNVDVRVIRLSVFLKFQHIMRND